MINSKELQEAIFHPKPNVEPAREIVRFDLNGKTDENKKTKISNVNAVAMIMPAGNSTVYKIKAKRGGQLYNPLKDDKDLSTIDKTTKNVMFQLKEVNQKAFNLYTQFLTTKHDSLLTAAEREV